jgi:N-acetyl-anhydromuramyl-L-alanine amidase AmpD
MRLIDFSARKIPAQDIKAAGYGGVVAYVSESRPGANFGAKPITREYADALRAQGLHIVSNFQYGKPGGSAPSDFTRGFSGGTADAQTALRLHEAAGGPDSAPIIFSIDEDINLATWNRIGVDWFRGINSVLGWERTGIYGHSRVCALAIQDGVVGHSTSPGRRWVWQTRAWSYGAREPAAVLFQSVIDTPSNPGPLVGGTRVDVNDVLAHDFGQWDLDRASVSAIAPPRFDESTEIRCPYYGSRGDTAVLWFVLHTEDGRSPSARHLARYLSSNPHRVSYHYTVDNDGHVYNIVDTQNYANSVLQPGNSKSINLAFAGSWANWSRQTWFDRMRHGMDVAAYIAVRDARRNGLQPRVISPEEARRGVTGITDHNGVRIATGRGTHTDVGADFPWDYFIGKVNEFASMAATARATSLSQPYPGAPIVQGATGPQVAMIQDRLNTVADAGLLVDGEFAPLTSRAVVAFQGNRGLPADGRAGSQTWAELFSDGRILHDINGHRSAPASTEPEADHYPPVGGSCSGQHGEPVESGPIPADYEPEPSISSSQLQQLRGWGFAAAVTEPTGEVMSHGGWLLPYPEPLRVVTPINPGPPVDRSRKIRNVTGPGLTDRFGMAATDLGVMTRTPSGRILAVFGDTFREPWVGGGDWRAPVALFSDTKNLDDGLVWNEAAGGDPTYARQLWPYPHHLDGGLTTVLPSDVMTIGESIYLHASAHFPFGNVGFTEIWKSIDDGHTWFRIGPRWDPHIHGGLAQLWTWDVGDDGWVYVLSTAFRIERDRPIILRRVPADRIADPSAYEGWGFGASGWAWRNEPTPVLEGGFGELCLRRVQNQWVLVVFDNFGYDVDVRVFPDMTSNLYQVPTGAPIRGTAWGQEGDDAVAQLYGPSIVPGSRLDGGFHILLSQWNTVQGWPYHVMQFKIPVPATAPVPSLDKEVTAHDGHDRRTTPG